MIILISSLDENRPHVTIYGFPSSLDPAVQSDEYDFFGPIETTHENRCLYASKLHSETMSMIDLDCNASIDHVQEKMKQDMTSDFKRVMDEGQRDASVDWNVEGGDGKSGCGLMLLSVGGDLKKWKWW